MSKEYKTIRVPKPVFAELEGVKREGETWEGLMRRLLDGNQSPLSQETRDALENMTKAIEDGLLSKEMEQSLQNVSEIMDSLPERTADELEGRMR